MKSIFINIKNAFKLIIQNRKFRNKNSHNFVRINRLTDINKISVGNYTYGNLNVISFHTGNANLRIGNYCSIADDVTFLLGGEHNYKTLMTYPCKAKFLNQYESFNKGNIEIGNDVWIGYGSLILSGVKIGQGAVVGAGSVVTKDIPPYAIYAGGKIIKYRFSKEIIEKLLKIDYSKIDSKNVKLNIEKFYVHIDEDNIDKIIKDIYNNN